MPHVGYRTVIKQLLREVHILVKCNAPVLIMLKRIVLL